MERENGTIVLINMFSSLAAMNYFACVVEVADQGFKVLSGAYFAVSSLEGAELG